MCPKHWLLEYCDELLDDIAATVHFPTEVQYWTYTVCFWRDELKRYVSAMIMPSVNRASEILSSSAWSGVNLIYSHWPSVLLVWNTVQSRVVRNFCSWMFSTGSRKDRKDRSYGE